MSVSTILPSDLNPVTSGATACDHLRELANTRAKMKTFLTFLLNEDVEGETDGSLTDGFIDAILDKLLVDPDKKSWFVQTDATTGELKLIQKIPITGLESPESDEDDEDERIIVWNGTAWEFQLKDDEFYGAPTSGGTTPPASSVGGTLSAAHGFDAAPKQFACFLECTTAEHDYSVGDRLDALGLMHHNAGGPATRQGVNVGVNATQIFAVFMKDGGGGFSWLIPHKTTYALVELTPANWAVKFWAKD